VATRMTIISGAPQTCGSCVRPTDSASNIHTLLFRWGKITQIELAIDSSLERSIDEAPCRFTCFAGQRGTGTATMALLMRYE